MLILTSEGLQRVDLNKRGSTACGSQQTRVYIVSISTDEGLHCIDLNKRGSTLYRSQQTRVYIVSISTNEGLHCIDLNRRGSTACRTQQTRVGQRVDTTPPVADVQRQLVGDAKVQKNQAHLAGSRV